MLNQFIAQHGTSEGGDYVFGGAYTFADVAATPLFHRASVALPAWRGYSIHTAVEEQNLARLGAWLKVSWSGC